MYTDVCEIENVSRSGQFGETSENRAFESPCRVEQGDQDRKDFVGTRVGFRRLYILPPKTIIFKGDNIRTKRQRGVKITEEYVEVDEVFPIGRTTPHHLEVMIYNV